MDFIHIYIVYKYIYIVKGTFQSLCLLLPVPALFAQREPGYVFFKKKVQKKTCLLFPDPALYMQREPG
jgi:hypothetical protein